MNGNKSKNVQGQKTAKKWKWVRVPAGKPELVTVSKKPPAIVLPILEAVHHKATLSYRKPREKDLNRAWNTSSRMGRKRFLVEARFFERGFRAGLQAAHIYTDNPISDHGGRYRRQFEESLRLAAYDLKEFKVEIEDGASK